MKVLFDIDKYCKILYIFIKYQKTPKDYSRFGSTVYHFFQIYSQSGWLVEKMAFWHILAIGVISFTFRPCKSDKIYANFNEEL